MKGEKIRGKWVGCHSGGFACSNRYSFSFGEHYREVNHLTPLCLFWSRISSAFQPSLLSLSGTSTPEILSCFFTSSTEEETFPPFFSVVTVRMVAFPIFWICSLVACSAKAPRDTHCYLCGLPVSLLNLCILNYWSSCGKHSTALSKGLGNLSVTKTYICP